MAKKEKEKDPLLDEPGEEAPAIKPDEPPAKFPEPPMTPVSKPAVNQNDFEEMARSTKAALEKFPKVNFIIPLMPGEKEGAYETVTLNCYKLTIKKGVMVEIPRPLAEILAEHYKIGMEAGKDKLIDRSPEAREALG